MNYDAYMLLWQNAYIQLKQVDYVSNTAVRMVKVLKTSTFLVVTAGDAKIIIDEQPYHVQHCSIFHIGKSQSLHITAPNSISYFLISYKGDVIYKDAFMQHLQMQYQPFQTSFSCVPANPIAIHTVLQDMYCKWQSGSIQGHLSVKVSFYEFIYRVFQELAEGQGKPHDIDKAELARLYIEQHIREPLSIQALADLLNISTRHLLRIFKARYEVGPQIYLQELRIEKAKHYLIANHYGIKEIAISLGFEDENYFSRAFKKATNMAPSNFRLKYTSSLSEIAITNENHFQYNKNQLAQAKQFENEENYIMMTKISRHLKIPFLVSLFVLLAACGEDTKQSAEQKENATTSEEAKTRTVTDDSGREVEIPAKAERVVTDWYLGQILALDVVPVGAVTANLDYASFLKQYYKEGEISNIGTDGNASLEKILELKPDLIITWNKEDVEKYEKIAPTIVFAESAHKSATEEVIAMGEFLGRQDEASAFVQEFENRIAQAQIKINNAIPEGATFTIFDVFEKNATVVSNSSISGGRALYQILNMKPQEKVQKLFDTKESSSGRYEISYEVVGDYVGDYVFVINFFNKEEKFPSTWTNLDVVKNNKTIELEPEYYFASDPLSGLHQAEDMADKIVEFTKAQQQ
ncbi:helix-turn-helix domain-containing protein [Lysinibacillus xylanilyticus]|uniref:AraC family transcriptional regulator n=1 Tax=Lysinibacillus xylanilyticus TaxID=582475 RepID=UPI002E1CF979|nr:helix-turn-helix domain-containing protein [Lysinibacillus xylanilyticus]